MDAEAKKNILALLDQHRIMTCYIKARRLAASDDSGHKGLRR